MTQAAGTLFLLKIGDNDSPSALDLASLRAALDDARDDARVVLEGLFGGPAPKVIGTWSPPRTRDADGIPGYVMSYAPHAHPLRGTSLSIPRFQPFSHIIEWRDAVLRAAEDWTNSYA